MVIAIGNFSKICFVSGGKYDRTTIINIESRVHIRLNWLVSIDYVCPLDNGLTSRLLSTMALMEHNLKITSPLISSQLVLFLNTFR